MHVAFWSAAVLLQVVATHHGYGIWRGDCTEQRIYALCIYVFICCVATQCHSCLLLLLSAVIDKPTLQRDRHLDHHTVHAKLHALVAVMRRVCVRR
jgi:hypothetical protein